MKGWMSREMSLGFRATCVLGVLSDPEGKAKTTEM